MIDCKIGEICFYNNKQYIYLGEFRYYKLNNDIFNIFTIDNLINYKIDEYNYETKYLFYNLDQYDVYNKKGYGLFNKIENKEIIKLSELYDFLFDNGIILEIKGFVDIFMARSISKIKYEDKFLINDLENDYFQKNILNNIFDIFDQFYAIKNLNKTFNFYEELINFELLFVSKGKLTENKMDEFIKHIIKAYPKFANKNYICFNNKHIMNV